jgi:hypothetical protein
MSVVVDRVCRCRTYQPALNVCCTVPRAPVDPAKDRGLFRGLGNPDPEAGWLARVRGAVLSPTWRSRGHDNEEAIVPTPGYCAVLTEVRSCCEGLFGAAGTNSRWVDLSRAARDLPSFALRHASCCRDSTSRSLSPGATLVGARRNGNGAFFSLRPPGAGKDDVRTRTRRCRRALPRPSRDR